MTDAPAGFGSFNFHSLHAGRGDTVYVAWRKVHPGNERVVVVARSADGGAFVAFHGGHDRTPLPNEGYNVVFVPRTGGVPSRAWEVFADGFTGGGTPLPANAAHRPMGLAEGPDGSLYVTDDRGGRIWRIVYR